MLLWSSRSLYNRVRIGVRVTVHLGAGGKSRQLPVPSGFILWFVPSVTGYTFWEGEAHCGSAKGPCATAMPSARELVPI